MHYVPLHSACCSCRADCWSAAVQFALRQAAAAAWKAVLVHTQERSVLEKEERIKNGPVAVREEYVQGSTGARAHGTREAVKHARVLGRHADSSGHGEGSKNAERTNEHRVCVGEGEESEIDGSGERTLVVLCI